MVSDFFRNFGDLARDMADPTYYVQDGNTYINDLSKIDASRPYTKITKDGRQNITPSVPYSPASQLAGYTGRDMPIVPPEPRPVSTAPPPFEPEPRPNVMPPFDPRSLQGPDRGADQQRINRLPDSGPDIPSPEPIQQPVAPATTTPNMGAEVPIGQPQLPSMSVPDYAIENVNQRHQQALADFSVQMDEYFGGRFTPGDSVQSVLVDGMLNNPRMSTTERDNVSNTLADYTARDIVKDFARQMWDQLDSRQQELFIAEASIQVDNFTPNAQRLFTSRVSTETGRRDIFASMLDYVTSDNVRIQPDLVKIYEDLGLISKRPDSAPVERVSPVKDVPVVGEILNQFWNFATATKEERIFNNAVLGLTEGRGSSVEKIELNRSLVNSVGAIIDSISLSGVSSSDIELIDRVKERANNQNIISMLDYLDSEEIAELHKANAETSQMPLEQFLSLLAVGRSPTEIQNISSIRYPNLSQSDRYQSGLMSDAEALWYENGLTDEAVVFMSNMLTFGSNRDITKELRAYSDYNRNAQKDRDAIYNWLNGIGQYSANLELARSGRVNWMRQMPRNLITENIQPEDLLSMGVPVTIVAELIPRDDDGNILTNILGATFGRVKSLVSFGLDALDVYHDKQAESVLFNPNSPDVDPVLLQNMFIIRDDKLIDDVLDLGGRVTGLGEYNSSIEERARAAGLNKSPHAEDYFLPELRTGGALQTKFEEIYNSPFTSDEERDLILDTVGDLGYYEFNEDLNAFDKPNLRRFVNMVTGAGGARRYTIDEAISEISSGMSLYYHFALGLDTAVIPIVGGGTLTKPIKAGVRNIFRVPVEEFESASRLRTMWPGRAITADEILDLEPELIARYNQIERQIQDGVVDVERVIQNSTKAAPRIESGVFRLSGAQVDELLQEKDEISRVLTNARRGDEGLVVRTAIRDPQSSPWVFRTGSTLRDTFTVRNPIARQLKGVTKIPFGPRAIEESNDANFLSNLFTGSGLRNFEMSKRSVIVSNTFTVMDEVSQTLRKAELPQMTELAVVDDGRTYIGNVRRVLNDLANAGRSDTIDDFVYRNATHRIPTDRIWKTAELIGNDIDLARIPALNDFARIAANEEDYLRIRGEIFDRGKRLKWSAAKIEEAQSIVYRSQREWESHLFDQIKTAVQEALSQRILGRGFDEEGRALRLQNRIAQSMSMFILESPGFIMRNILSNNVAGSLDGVMPWKIHGRNPSWIHRFSDRLGEAFHDTLDTNAVRKPFGETVEAYNEIYGPITPLTFSFSPKGLAHSTMSEVGAVDLSLESNIFTTSMKSGLTKNPMGGGVPLIGGGVPYLRLRQISATYEAINRMRLTASEAVRYFEGVFTDEVVQRALANMGPETAEAINKLMSSGLDAARQTLGQGASVEDVTALAQRRLSQDLHHAVVDHSVLTNTSMARFIDNISVDGEIAMSIDLAPSRVAEALGFHVPHLNSESLATFREILNSGDPTAVSDAFGQMIRSNELALKHLTDTAEAFGIPHDAVEDILSIYDEVFRAAKEAGLPPKEASDLALSTMTEANFRIVGLYQRNNILQDYLADPELYRNGVFPYADGIKKTNAQLADTVFVPSSTMIHKDEILNHMINDDDVFGWRAAQEIFQEARNIPDEMASIDIPVMIRRAQDNLSSLRQQAFRTSRNSMRTNVDEQLEAAAAFHRNNFDPNWPVEQRVAFLKEETVRVAEIAPPNMVITSNPNSTFVRTHLAGAKPADVRRAIDELIENGTLQRMVNDRNKNVIVATADDILPTRRHFAQDIPNELKDTYQQYIEDITDLSMAVSEYKISQSSADIRRFQTNLDRSRRATIQNLKTGMRDALQSGTTDLGQLLSLANGRVDNFATTSKERFNEIADALGIQRAAIDADQESHLLGRFYGENMPSHFTQIFAAEAPTYSFVNELIGLDNMQLTELGFDKFRTMRSYYSALQQENARIMQMPFFQTVMRQADIDHFNRVAIPDMDSFLRNNSVSNEMALEWAQNVSNYTVIRPPQWDRTVDLVESFRADAGVAVIPEGMNVAPANVGLLPDSTTPGVPPRGVWGRTFQQMPPEGYIAIITNDDWRRIPGLKKGQYGTRFGLFVKDGTPEEEVVDFVRGLANTHYTSKVDPEMLDVISATGRQALEHNPEGFYASFQRLSADEVKRELAPFVAKAQAGDEIAMQVVQYARNQWRAGWPIAGHPTRTLQNVYDNFANSLKNDLPLGNHYTVLTREEGAAIQDAVRRLVADKNQLMDIAMEVGQAKANWILHDYNNTNDLDFLIRWLGPWHIWPSRTAGKLFTRVLDNPSLFVGYQALETALAVANENLPDYMQDSLPVSFILGALAAPFSLGKLHASDLGFGANVNINSVLFYNDLISSYQTAGEGATGLGSFFDTLDNLVPVYPFVGWTLNMTGQYGDTDRSEIAQQFVRPGEILLQTVAELVSKTGVETPTNLIMTDREINDINIEFALSLMEAWEKGDTEEFDRLTVAFDEWGRMNTEGVMRFTPLNYVGGLFGLTEMNTDIASIIRRASRNRRIGDASSYILGHKLYLMDGDKTKFFEFIDEFRGLLSQEFKSDAARSAAFNRFFENNPAVSVYFRNNNDQRDMNTLEQTSSMWFAGLEDINDELSRTLAGVRTTAANIQTEEQARTVTAAYLQRAAAQAALAAEIEEITGINPQNHPMFAQSYRITDPELRAIVESIGNIPLEEGMFVSEGTSYMGLETPILEHLDLLAAPDQRRMLEESVKKFAESQDTDPKYVTIGDYNNWLMSTQAQDIFTRVEQATNRSEFYNKKNGAYTNSLDFEAMLQAESDVFDSMPQSYQELYNQISVRGLTPERLVDRAINDWVGNAIEQWGSVFDQDSGWTSDQISAELTRIEDSYEPPTVDDIMNLLNERTQGLWKSNNDISEQEMRDVIASRLSDSAKIGDLNSILNGRFDDNIGALEAGFAELERLRNEPKSAVNDQLIRELTGYEENGQWHAGTLRHFQTPSGYIITTPEELAEFKEAYELNQDLSRMHDQGTHVYLDPLQFPEWSKYFDRDHVEETNKSQLLDMLAENNEWDLFYEVLDYFNSGKESNNEGQGAVYNPDGSVKRPTSGIPSAGRTPTRDGSFYRFPDTRNEPVSRNGVFTRSYLDDNFTGSKREDLPPDYIFELLAQNGVTEEAEIEDFFWSIYEANEPVFGDQFDLNDDVAYTLFTYTEGEKDRQGYGDVSTYQYLVGINGLFDVIYNTHRSSAYRPSGTSTGSGSGGSTRTSSTRTSTSRNRDEATTSPYSSRDTTSGSSSKSSNDLPSFSVKLPRDWKPSGSNRATPSSNGVGGLPEWKEAAKHMQSVFHDPSLLEDVIKYFRERNHRITNNHMRMLRAMYRTFPIESASTFEEWLSALRLMFQTADIMNYRRPTVTNPGYSAVDNQPRIARFRE